MIQEQRRNFIKEKRLKWKVIQHHDEIIKDMKAEDLSFTIGNDDYLAGGVLKFESLLGKMSNLKNINLNLGSCYKINDNGIDKLCHALSKLIDLSRLELNFSGSVF